MDLSRHGKNETERRALTSWRRQREGLVRTRKIKRPSDVHSLPGDGRGKDLSGRTRKATDRATRTHQLETEDGGICQDAESNRLSEAHSHSGNVRGTNLSGYEKKQTERRALTRWKRQREGLVMTRKATDQETRTHTLETAEGGTCKDTERSRPSNAHSLSGDGRGKDVS